MNLTDENKIILADAIACYYSNYVWKTLRDKDNAEASDLDYKIRELCMELEIKDKLPLEIHMGF